jgi:hypothetical protein
MCCFYFSWICIWLLCVEKNKTNLKPLLSHFPRAQPGPRLPLHPAAHLLSLPLFYFSPPTRAGREPNSLFWPNSHRRPASPSPSLLSLTLRPHASGPSPTSRHRRLLPTWPTAPTPLQPSPAFSLPSTELRINPQCPMHEPPRPFPSRHAAPSPTTIHGGRRCARAPPPCRSLLFPSTL